MAATIFIEQDQGTWTGTPHRYNGYSSGFTAPRSETTRTERKAAQALTGWDHHDSRTGR